MNGLRWMVRQGGDTQDAISKQSGDLDCGKGEPNANQVVIFGVIPLGIHNGIPAVPQGEYIGHLVVPRSLQQMTSEEAMDSPDVNWECRRIEACNLLSNWHNPSFLTKQFMYSNMAMGCAGMNLIDEFFQSGSRKSEFLPRTTLAS